MNYQEFIRATEHLEWTCFVYDEPNNRYNYGFGPAWDEININAPEDGEYSIVPIKDFQQVKDVMMKNYETEMRPSDNVEDDGFDEMMEAFRNDTMYLGIWRVGDAVTYMLVYDYDPAEQERIRIGDKIKGLRKEAGMTQTQLAEKCGMAQPNIARIEAGTYATSIDVLSRIAEAFGKRIDLV